MKEKIIKNSEMLFLVIYILFSLTIFITQFRYTNPLKCILLYFSVILILAIILKLKNSTKKLINNKIYFISCIVIGILFRISLLFLDYKELVGVGDYQTFFNNASKFCSTNTISQTTYVGLFPFLMPYMVILGSFFKIAGITYKSVVLLNIIIDLFIPLFLYFTFKNKSISKCASVLYLLNPIALIWCMVCCPVTLVNFGISLSILVFSILLRNINNKKFIILSVLTGIIMAISNSFRPIMVIMLIAIFLYYIYINMKSKKLNVNYLISFILILVSFFAIKNVIFLGIDKINHETVSRTSGWTLYLGSNLNSYGAWYSEPKLDEFLKSGLTVEETQQEFQKLAIERYKSNGLKNIKLFAAKFTILTGNIPNYTSATFSGTTNIKSETIVKIVKLTIYLYVFVSIILNILIAIQNLKNKKNVELSIFYMLFYIGIIISHLFVEVSPRYYMPALIPICILNSITLYENFKTDSGDVKND